MQMFLTAQATASPLMTLVFPVLILGVFYFLIIRPQKKREKEISQMRESLKVGDVVITIGGIKGKLIKVGEDEIVLETGPNNMKMELMRWSVGSNLTQEKNKEK